MSAGERAFGLIKNVFTMQDKLDALGRDVTTLGDRMTRLTESHGALRDRVSRFEGVIEGAAMAARQRRIEG